MHLLLQFNIIGTKSKQTVSKSQEKMNTCVGYFVIKLLHEYPQESHLTLYCFPQLLFSLASQSYYVQIACHGRDTLLQIFYHIGTL